MYIILVKKHSHFVSGRNEFLPSSLRSEATLDRSLTCNPRFDKPRSRPVGPLVGKIDESIKRAGNLTGTDHSEVNFDRLFPCTAGHIAPPYFPLARTPRRGICSALRKDSQRVVAESSHDNPRAAIRAVIEASCQGPSEPAQKCRSNAYGNSVSNDARHLSNLLNAAPISCTAPVEESSFGSAANTAKGSSDAQ